ncbi:AEC family transporter [Leptolyngbya sp. FACHB-261]|nr:AEC family transporter [Leptolyngbya sp. FACHB-261]
MGRFLYWVGVPFGVFGWLRQADLSGPVWLAALMAWGGVGIGAALAKLWLNRSQDQPHQQLQQPAAQGSFFLASMFGNTGYIGFPVVLALCGLDAFGWAVFYDLLGTTVGAYGLGVGLAAHFRRAHQQQMSEKQTIALQTLLEPILYNPTPWCFTLALVSRPLALPSWLETGLQQFAWGMIPLSLILLGMRLVQVSSWHSLDSALPAIGIKLLLVPLLVGAVSTLVGLTGLPRLTVVLQAAMPPAFATLVLAETYDLDRTLTVTALSVGSMGVLLTLPLWLMLFG